MLRLGAVILTIWGGVNFALASLLLVLMTILGKPAPMLFIVFEEPEIPALEPKVVAATNALAILFNACAAAFSLLVLVVVWSALVKGEKWAFWALLLSIGLVQAFGFVADSAIGNKTVYVNLVLTALFLAGIGLAGWAMFTRATV
ncbi:MAG: hypothetical protein HY706_14550 [Candidatus Hydrogenedentes bacterium]|nr:hypothetical protein [Candidatus Hydrogenedentota bacterium]